MTTATNTRTATIVIPNEDFIGDFMFSTDPKSQGYAEGLPNGIVGVEEIARVAFDYYDETHYWLDSDDAEEKAAYECLDSWMGDLCSTFVEHYNARLPQLIRDGINYYYSKTYGWDNVTTLLSKTNSHTIVKITLPEDETVANVSNELLYDAIRMDNDELHPGNCFGMQELADLAGRGEEYRKDRETTLAYFDEPH